MVIFKRLALKALSALQDHEGGGGTENNYANVSFRLDVIIHQYINAQSHLLHTLYLPLPLNPHTHTHTHTTHTRTQQIRQI